MTHQLVSESLSPGFTRLGRGAATTVSDLGPLADLVGTWFSNSGMEVMAVPTANGKAASARIIIRPYIEILTVRAIGAPVPSRGGLAGDRFLNGVLYEIHITDAVTTEPLHVENGMWLYLGEGETPSVVRVASIPHGDAVLAVGEVHSHPGPPNIVDSSALPLSGPDTPPGYTDQYENAGFGFDPSNVNAGLQAVIKPQQIVQTTNLSVTTMNGGGITNIPFVDRNAKAAAFNCDYWIETVEKPNGRQFQQLQYSQQTDIVFLPTFGGPPGSLILWPHTNVATLLKQ